MAIPTDLAQVAAQQLANAYVGFIDSMSDFFQSAPGATQAQAVAHLNGLAYPDPTSPIQFTDRVSLFSYLMARVHPYDGQATEYLSLRQLLLDHPKAVIRQLDVLANRTGSNKAEIIHARATNPLAGWEPATVTGHENTRDPAKGNFVVSERWTIDADGQTYTVQETFTVVADGSGGWTSTPVGMELI